MNLKIKEKLHNSFKVVVEGIYNETNQKLLINLERNLKHMLHNKN